MRTPLTLRVEADGRRAARRAVEAGGVLEPQPPAKSTKLRDIAAEDDARIRG